MTIMIPSERVGMEYPMAVPREETVERVVSLTDVEPWPLCSYSDGGMTRGRSPIVTAIAIVKTLMALLIPVKKLLNFALGNGGGDQHR